jgi:hypothetical protein
MAEKLQAIAQVLRDHKIEIAGLASTGLVAAVSAETFNFSILTDLTDSLIAIMPNISELVNTGGPLVINFCIVAAVCAPFIWIAKKAGVL